jgi:hypothetical protein
MKKSKFSPNQIVKILQSYEGGKTAREVCRENGISQTTCPTGSGAGCEESQNIKHFFYFKVGSWWVYEEESSGVRDSVYVTEASENSNDYLFDIRVYSTYQDYFYHFWPVNGQSFGSSCSDGGLSCGRCFKVRRSKYKPGDFIGEATCFIFQPLLGEKDYNPHNDAPENEISVFAVDDSLQLGNYTFGRTIKMFEQNTFMEGKQPTNHYFSENVGLVRKELLDSNQIWNLVDYYIEQ